VPRHWSPPLVQYLPTPISLPDLQGYHSQVLLRVLLGRLLVFIDILSEE